MFMTDLELIINEFCIPTEADKVCVDLAGWNSNKNPVDWCERNCGITNCGKYPEMNCYKEWLKKKRREEDEQQKTR